MGVIHLTGFQEAEYEANSVQAFWLQGPTTPFLVDTFYPTVTTPDDYAWAMLQGTGLSFLIDFDGGRFGGNALTHQITGGGEHTVMPFYNTCNTIVYDGAGPAVLGLKCRATIGFAFKFSQGGLATQIFTWYRWVQEQVLPYQSQGWFPEMTLGMTANNILYIMTPEVVYYYGKTPLYPGRYYYIEWKVSTDISLADAVVGVGTKSIPNPAAAGDNQVLLDGALEIDVAAGTKITSVYTPKATGMVMIAKPSPYAVFEYISAGLQKLIFHYDNRPLQVWMTDFYCTTVEDASDPTREVVPDFLGDCAINLMKVDPAGVPTLGDAWELDGVTTKNNAVAKTEVFADGYYVASNTVGAIQSFRFLPMRAGASAIHAAGITALAEKSDTSSRNINLCTGTTGGSVVRCQNGGNLRDYYTVTSVFFGNNLVTGLPWTEAAVNNLEAGPILVR